MCEHIHRCVYVYIYVFMYTCYVRMDSCGCQSVTIISSSNKNRSPFASQTVGSRGKVYATRVFQRVVISFASRVKTHLSFHITKVSSLLDVHTHMRKTDTQTGKMRARDSEWEREGGRKRETELVPLIEQMAKMIGRKIKIFTKRRSESYAPDSFHGNKNTFTVLSTELCIHWPCHQQREWESYKRRVLLNMRLN